MLIKLLIILAFLAIVYSLASSLYFLLNDKPGASRTARALSWRIGLSIMLFALIMLGIASGVIQPHGLLPVR